MLKRVLLWLADRCGAARPVWAGTAGASVLRVDRNGKIAGHSKGAKFKGLKFIDIFLPEDRQEAARLLSLGAAAGHGRLRLGGEFGGESVDVAASLTPTGGAAVLLFAASESEELAALRAEAEEARREARETADLLADLGHEMRTPLNAVLGFAGAMQAEMFGPLGHPKYQEYVEHIKSSGGHLLDLVSSILDLARIEADRFSLRRQAVDAGALAEQCAGIVRISAEAAGLKLTTDIAEDIPESFLDPRAVRQILFNLLSNAVKFTSDGEIKLSAKAADGDIVLTVADTGVGMSDAELRKLGARFTAAHGPGVRGAKGAGLGLALAFALTELHGGRMSLQSAPGEGVTATVRLPIVSPASPVRPRRRDPAALSAANPALLTQLERIEAYRRERASAA